MKTFTSIQHLRGIAALMVVAFHLLQPARGIVFPAWTSFAGASGVDIFFVISGFIIYVSQTAENRGAVDFARRRLSRVVPLYWLFTLVLIGLHLTAHLNADLSLTPMHVVQSFLLIPHINPAGGLIEPLLVPGWTLQYEMFFYLLFAIVLVIAPPQRVVWMSVVLVALVAAGLVLRPASPILSSFTNPRLLEFLAGVLLGAAVRAKPDGFPDWGWIGVPLGLAGLWATDLASQVWREAWGWGPIAVLIVAGALCLDLHGRALKAPLLKTLGDASYSIYLSHLITLGIVRQGWRLLVPPSANPLIFAAFALIAFLAATAVGMLVYWWVEKPMLTRLNTLFRPPRAAAATCATPRVTSLMAGSEGADLR